ncbi:HutD/Ves family protein [Marinomonas sp. PE14-40]|uniref:HutD/Ves family protein n=1 Tax=Marinomonas sp. PE14-40 TaxID=3060621 RepID=UPI003F6618CF
MSQETLITQAQFRRMPWKNGKGETLELLKLEDEKGVKFRISQAAVSESGVFSDFSGLERHLVLIAGKGMRLEHQSEQGHVTHDDLLHELDIATFYGGDMTTSELLNGPIEDLNIMVRRADTKALVQALYAPCDALSKPGQQAYFYANQVSNISVDQGAKDLIMPKDSFLIMDKESRYHLRKGTGVLIEISEH